MGTKRYKLRLIKGSDRLLKKNNYNVFDVEKQHYPYVTPSATHNEAIIGFILARIPH